MGWLSVYPILRRGRTGGRVMSPHRDVDQTAGS